MINQLHLAMIELYKGDAKRIQHFCKVHSYAKLIAETENVDKKCLFTIEAAALTHDIGIHFCKEKYGIDDDDIYEAVFYHTTGKPDMGLLAEIVFIADLIEEGRDAYFPWAPAMRELAKKDLHEALLGVMDRSLESLIEQRKCIYPLTVVARNRLLQNK